MLALAGCARGPFTPRSTITGVVISADGPNAADVDRFTLRTNDGAIVAFVVGTLEQANGGLPAPHLREHLVSGEPIIVDYRVEGAQNVAIRYADAAT